MSYWHYLVGLSLAFAVVERVRPMRPAQRVWRRDVVVDLLYVVVNGHLLGVLLAWATAPLSTVVDAHASQLRLQVLTALPLWQQALVAFVLLDALQWCIHNALHRVPWLWQFHKVHHSIVELDWLGSLRFHWVEIVVYKSVQYLPLLALGVDGRALLAVAVVGTAIGHGNHSNVDVDFGMLRYLFNSPRMHAWHHVHPDAGPSNINFGVCLSVWDWLFGTAHLPSAAPAAIGLAAPGVPRSWLAQQLWPLSRLLRPR